MQRFRFRLSAVEKLRKEEADRALQSVAQARQVLEKAKLNKQQHIIARNKALSRQERLAGKGAMVEEFFIEDRFIRGQEKRIEHAELGIQKALRLVEKAVRGYQTARRKLLQIERLHQKARTTFEEALRKHEQKELRDLMVMRARWITHPFSGGAQ